MDRPQESSTPTIRFTTTEEIYHQISRLLGYGDILIVTDVSPEDYDKISEARRWGMRLQHYYSDTRTLVITFPSALHDQLHYGLYGKCTTHITLMGLSHEWRPIGSAIFRRKSHPDGDGAEGDSCGGPVETRGDGGEWPTIVIEAGDSQTIGGLRKGMRWWFSASEHDVKIVLLASFEHHRNLILIEHYEEETFQQGATHTQNSSTLRPVLRKEIEITQNTGNPPTYNVVSGVLTLRFKLFFERDPRQGEGDIVISVAELQHYAGVVWRQIPNQLEQRAATS